MAPFAPGAARDVTPLIRPRGIRCLARERFEPVAAF